ncbi:MAG: hypothetical protein COA69_03780 [Robiginitomaculum sp.]|nr:MAG: hypothetical protein COA69_03780 [Robiginitomaculum sp.]
MTKGRDIVKPKWQMLALKAGLGLSACAVLSLSPSLVISANAQTVSTLEKQGPEQQPEKQDTDRPVVASVDPRLDVDEALPKNLQPEELSVPKAQTLNPLSERRSGARRNSWNPATLTQSTGLTAASYRAKSADLNTNGSAKIGTDTPVIGARAIDLISAQDLLATNSVSLQADVGGLSASSRKDGVINLSSPLRGTLFDLPTSDNVNASVFNLESGERLCFGTSTDCKANDRHSIDFGYAKNITRGKRGGLNVQLTPRAGLRFDEHSKSALVGALVRIGDNLREGSEMKSNTWYLFAGADAEAVTYTPSSVRRLTSGDFHLQSRIIVGDAQAGLGYRFGSADLALTYFRRQATAENYKYDEDAAALSITWKR